MFKERPLGSFVATSLLTLIISGCGGGGGGGADPAPVDVGGAQGDCPAVGNILPLEVGASQCQISGVLTEDATLTSNFTWFLSNRFQVGNDAENVTLSVDPDTQIRGDGTDHVLVLAWFCVASQWYRSTTYPFFV